MIFEEKIRPLLESAVLPSATAFIAYVVRVIMRRHYPTFWSFCLDAVSAVVVGVMAYNLTAHYRLGEDVRAGIVALAGMIGPDLLAGTLVLTSTFAKSPSAFILKHVYAFRGVADPSAALKDTRAWEAQLQEQPKAATKPPAKPPEATEVP